MLVELGLVELRYQAVSEVLNDAASVTDVARRYGVARQTVGDAPRASGVGIADDLVLARTGGLVTVAGTASTSQDLRREGSPRYLVIGGFVDPRRRLVRRRAGSESSARCAELRSDDRRSARRAWRGRSPAPPAPSLPQFFRHAMTKRVDTPGTRLGIRCWGAIRLV